MTNIIVEASKVWDVIQSHRSSMYKVAENTDYGIEVYVSIDKNIVVASVEADGSPLYEEVIYNSGDCVESMSRIYDTYLTDKVIGIIAGDDCDIDDSTQADEEDLISERESELSEAIYEFMVAVFGEEIDASLKNFDEVCEDLKDHFLEYMARKHGLRVWRPMYLEDDSGADFFEDYPYECMVFDDKDNPVYK